MKKNIRVSLLDASTRIPRLDAEVLLSHTLNKPREYLLAHPETPLPFFKRLQFLRAVKKRGRGIPVAHITGHKEFYGLDFLVDKHTLVPRPETEMLVEITNEEIKKLKKLKEIILIDMGTGSGCIPISILKTTQSHIQTFATDISRSALRIAKKNAQKHNVDITFLHGNLLEPFLNTFSPLEGRGRERSRVVITANLPYLTAAQFAEEPSIQHEPKTALVAPDNGLALYKELLEQIASLQPSTFNLTAFFEIDPSQSSTLTSHIKQLFPAATIEIKKDLSGNDRVVCISLK